VISFNYPMDFFNGLLSMEHPESVTWPFYGIIAAYSIFVTGCSVYFHEAQVLFWGFGMLLVAVVAWFVLALLNIVMFPSIFRLLARLTRSRKIAESDHSHDQPT
jgi:hypothetical protein